MRYSKFLGPQQPVAPEDWNLADRRANRARAAWFKTYPSETFCDFPTAILLVQAGNIGGQIGLISKTTGLLEYYVHYETAHMLRLGRCATQVKLWRSRFASVQGLARIGFNDILLARFDTVVSDTEQTDRGEEFWEVQMSGFASSKSVGLIDGAGIHCFGHSTTIEDWVKAQDGWGQTRDFRRKRFFISNLPVDTISPDTISQDGIAAASPLNH